MLPCLSTGSVENTVLHSPFEAVWLAFCGVSLNISGSIAYALYNIKTDALKEEVIRLLDDSMYPYIVSMLAVVKPESLG